MADTGDQRGAIDPPEAIRAGRLTALLQEIAAAPDAPRGLAWEGALRAGSTVGRFELVRELGRGGFGVVWEARDRELGRLVAFKAVRAGGKASVREERLLREAESAARLSHPNIVTLYDVGRTEQGPYLVLELLRGVTLAERLGHGPLPLPEALRIAVDVAKGLAHAHEQGVVHRDLKPENVFLCEDGQVKVLDFGMAHAFGQRRADGGTTGYMAPEQAEGAPEDERTDVFALGVMLFEMLAGKLPFADEKALRSPTRAPVLEVPGQQAIGDLVERMLAKRAVDRPRDGRQALTAIRVLEQEALRVPMTGPVRARRRSRLRAALLAAAAAGAATVAATWWTAWVHRPERTHVVAPSPGEPVTLAVLPLANLSGDASQEYLADGMTEEIIGKLSRLRGLAVTARSSVAKYKMSTIGAREIAKELGVAYLVEGSIRRDGDRIRIAATLVKASDGFQVWSESIDAKLGDIFDAQERVATRIVEALHLRLTPDEAGSLSAWGTRNVAAYEEYLRGQVLVEHFHQREKLEAARGHFERALQIDPQFAPAMAGLASAEAQSYRNIDNAPERLERARALVERALVVDPVSVRALFASAEIRGVSYDYEGAAARFRQITALEPRNYLAWDYLCWALGYVTPPELAEAERACRHAIGINPAFGESYYHLARVLIPQGRLSEAEQALRQLEEHFPESYLVRSGWFWLHLGAERPREALAAVEQDRQIRGTSLGRAWAAMALAQLAELDRAFAALDEAMALGYRDAPDLRTNRYFEPLRRDRRFASLMAKHGIDPGTRAR